jgi:hypothetical protein
MLAMSSVSLHIVEVHLLGSIGLGPLRIKGDSDLDEGLLRNPRLILPHGEGFLPLHELPPPTPGANQQHIK